MKTTEKNDSEEEQVSKSTEVTPSESKAPAKIESELSVVKNKKEDSDDGSLIQSEIANQIKTEALKKIIPFLQKHTKPAVDDLMKYLGVSGEADSKIIVLNNTSEGGFLMILDAAKVNLQIPDEDAMLQVFEVYDGLERILSGEMEGYLKTKKED